MKSPTPAATTSHDETKLFFTTAELSRLMVPADANVAGNVHGGTIMQMIEESACVAASRFFNHYSDNPDHNDNGNNNVKVLTARVESITFQHPLHVGDVAKVQARVVFASEHTVAVAVKLLAERLSRKEEMMVGNRALLWIVGHLDCSADAESATSSTSTMNTAFCRAKAPKLDPPTDEEGLMAYKLAAMAYKKRKAHEQSDPASLPDSDIMNDDEPDNNKNNSSSAAAASINPVHPNNPTKDDDDDDGDDAFNAPDQCAVELAQVMLPADCVTGAGLVRGGVVMKLMDNACGVAAVRHCGTNVVTISVDAMDLVAPVLLGDVLRIAAKPIFTSSKSMEIEAKVIAERFSVRPEDGRLVRTEIVSTKQAYFTFVSLGTTTTGKALPMRPLAPQTEDEKRLFQQGKQRYEQRKALRAAGGAIMMEQP